MDASSKPSLKPVLEDRVSKMGWILSDNQGGLRVNFPSNTGQPYMSLPVLSPEFAIVFLMRLCECGEVGMAPKDFLFGGSLAKQVMAKGKLSPKQNHCLLNTDKGHSTGLLRKYDVLEWKYGIDLDSLEAVSQNQDTEWMDITCIVKKETAQAYLLEWEDLGEKVSRWVPRKQVKIRPASDRDNDERHTISLPLWMVEEKKITPPITFSKEAEDHDE